MARYLITGVGGFIASNLAKALVQSGAQVVGIEKRASANLESLKAQGLPIETVQGDVTESIPVSGDWDAVFHHGDITDPRHEPQDEVYRKNVAGFKNVLALCRKQKCRLVFASTAGLYGNGPVPMQESSPPLLLTEYARSKNAMEQLAKEHGGEIPIIGLRYFNVFGPGESHKGQAASMIFHLFHQIKANQNPRLFEFGEHSRDFIYVADVVEACLCSLRAGSGIYNVGTGVATDFNAVVAAVASAMGVDVAIEYFKMPFDPETYQNKTQADTQRARAELGFVAEWSFREAVADYVRKLKQEYSVEETPGNGPANNSEKKTEKINNRAEG